MKTLKERIEAATDQWRTAQNTADRLHRIMTGLEQQQVHPHQELFDLINAQFERTTGTRSFIASIILKAHNGRPQDFVTNENLHLLRRYRNGVSGDPMTMINDAVENRT